MKSQQQNSDNRDQELFSGVVDQDNISVKDEEDIIESFEKESGLLKSQFENQVQFRNHQQLFYGQSLNNNNEKKKFKKKKRTLLKVDIYDFPVKLLKRETINGKEEFKFLLLNQAMKQQRSEKGWVCAQRKLESRMRMYVRCQFCKAKIIYQINEDRTWTLVTFDNRHSHSLESKKGGKIAKELAIFSNINFSTTTSNNYELNRAQLLRKKKEIIENSNFSMIHTYLQHLDYDLRYMYHFLDTKKQGYPINLLAISTQQKKNHKRYGECLSFDVFDNFIKEKTFQQKKLKVGIFSGFDNNNRIVIFGLSFSTFEKVQDFQTIFTWYFDVMGYKNISAVITSAYEEKIIQTLIKLKKENSLYNFHHVYDSSHFVKEIKTKLRPKMNQDLNEFIESIVIMLKEPDPNFGLSQFNKIETVLKKEGLEEDLKKLTANFDHYCLWKMPTQFFGLNLHSNQCLSDLLKLKESDTVTYKFLQKFDEFSKDRAKKSVIIKKNETYPFQILFNDDEIEQVRSHYQKKAFTAFIQQYNRSQLYIITNQNPNRTIFMLQHLVTKFKYKVQRWKCECGVFRKTGIPCEHVIHIKRMQFYEKRYIDLFNERWQPEQQESSESIQKQKRRLNKRHKFKKKI